MRTKNSLYEIVVVQPWFRAVLVQGGSFFPQATPAVLSGSSFGGSMLKLAWVGIGLRMEFHFDRVSDPSSGAGTPYLILVCPRAR